MARGVCRLTLNTPAKHNVLSALAIREISDAARSIGASVGVRAVVLAAEGVSFCAGGDLGWMREQMGGTRAQRIEAARARVDDFRN